MLVMMLSTVTIISSCGGDDGSNNPADVKPANPVLGTKWVAENGYYFYFKTSTTGIYYSNNKGDSYEDFNYVFNTKDNTIVLQFNDEYESVQYTTAYIIKGSRKYYKE